MKHLIRIVSIIGLFSMAQVSYSIEITDTYITGDTLTAAKLNNIKSAVNDNEARIMVLEAAPKANLVASPPSVDDDINNGYPVGSVWVDITQKQAYVSVDSSPGLAVWTQITNNFYSIGDTGPAGGIVFHVTDGGTHGLEAAPVDQSAAPWGCSGTDITGADGTAIGTGAQNTANILAACAETPIAASIVAGYMLNGYSDWFLPSKDELKLVFLNISQGSTTLGNVGGFADGGYQTSSQGGTQSRWVNNFSSGGLFEIGYLKKDAYKVRAVRAF